MIKVLKQPGQFFLMLVFLITVQCLNAQQISKELYNALPPMLKPIDQGHVTTDEKRKILKSIGLYFSEAVYPEVESLALSLETLNKRADRNTRIENFGALNQYYSVTGDYDKVLAYSDSSIRLINKDTAYGKLLANTYLTKGQILTFFNRQEEAFILYNEGLNIYRQRNDTISMGNLYVFRSKLYSSLSLFAQSINDEALGFRYLYSKITMPEKKEYVFCNFHVQIASSYLNWYIDERNRQHLDSAEKHIDVILKNKTGEAGRWVAYCYFLKSKISYMDSGYKEAIAYMDSSFLPKYTAIEAFPGFEAQKKLYKGILLVELGRPGGTELIKANYEGVEKTFIKAIAARILYEDAEAHGNYKEALHWFSIYKADEDSTDMITQRGKVFEAEQKYKVKEKENAIVKLELANIAEKKEKTFVSLVSVIIMLILFSVIISLYGLNRKRQLKALRTQQKLEDRLRDAEALFMQQENNIQAEKNKTITELQQKISRDMHDGLGNALATLRYYVANKQQKETVEKNKLVLADIEAEVNSVYVQVRDYMHSLNKGLDSAVYDFASFLVSLSEQFSDPDGLHIVLHVDVNSIKARLNAEEQNQMKLIVKEAITNTMKHATATEVMLSINFDDKHCNFNIKDNGKGFSVALAGKGLGLESIRSRMNLLGGSIFIESFGNGTNLKGVFPLAA